jgi:hypothetical protein
MRTKAFVVSVLILVVAPATVAQDLMGCRAIYSDTLRLACYDAVAGRVQKALDEDIEGPATTRIKEREESLKAAVIGDYDMAQQEFEGFTIKAVTRNAQRKPIYESNDGRMFQQVSGLIPLAREGERVELEQGLFGAVFIRTQDGLRFKVKEK